MTSNFPIYLKPFCDPASYCYLMAESFVVNGYRYATDGRIMVRVPTNEPDSMLPTPPEGEKQKIYPSVRSIPFNHAKMVPPPSTWPLWPLPCYEKLGEATDLEGDPVSDFHHPADSEARIKLVNPHVHDGGEFLYTSLRYDMIVRAFLPNPRFYCVPSLNQILIAFDGGEGILMALDTQDEKEDSGSNHHDP